MYGISKNEVSNIVHIDTGSVIAKYTILNILLKYSWIKYITVYGKIFSKGMSSIVHVYVVNRCFISDTQFNLCTCKIQEPQVITTIV